MDNYRTRKLGVIPSPKDYRDFHVTRFVRVKAAFPREFTVAPLVPAPYDQGDVGACVAFALKAIKEMQEQKERGKLTYFSAAYVYAAREEKHYQGEGMVPRDALDILLKRGVCREELFPGIYPYPVAASMLTDEMHQDAYPQRILAYAAIYTVEEMKAALMELGPVLVVIPVYDSFYQGGELPKPNTLAERMYGFHALTVVGWTPNNRWLALNSWGQNWGTLHGYCTLPFDYPISEMWTLTDYAPDEKKNEGKFDYQLFIEPAMKGFRRNWLVHLGRFASREEALERVAKPLQQDLAKLGKHCRVRL